MSPKRLAIITTHPIQYHAPWYRALALNPEIELEVFYCHRATPKEQADAGFGVEFDWDVSLLDGYSHHFLKNVAERPAVSGFNGLDTPEIQAVIARERFDAVMVNGWHYKSAWQTMRACWKTGTPVMARSDSHLHTERGFAKRAAKWPLYQWFIPKLDACLAVGTWSKEYFLRYGAHPERIFLVPHVIDQVFFEDQWQRWQPQRDVLRQQWGLPAKATAFLFAGKFVATKRPIDFIRAIHAAATKGAGIAGLMVGDGSLRTKCEEFVHDNNVPVRFTGFLNQSELVKAYVAADALVLPSDGETWGLVVNEAMSCGLPCVVSDQVGCSPDMIVPELTGSVFPAGDCNGLAELLASLAAHPAHLRQLGRHAKQMATTYSTNSAVDGILQALTRIGRQH